MSSLRRYVLNGGHVLFACIMLCFIDPLFSLYIYLKIQPTLYYHTFSHLYSIPYYKWKHMIRLTDTGFYANMLYYFYPEMLPLSFNIHFMITFGFWFAVIFVNMKEVDDIEHEDIIPIFHNIHAVLNHTISFMILFYQNMVNDYYFGIDSLSNSYVWVYCWLLFIYIPWRVVTGDIVYSVLDTRNSKKSVVFMYFFIHVLLHVSNELGKKTSGILKD